VATVPANPTGPLALMTVEGHEQVVFCHDAESGLRAIVAIWSTALGPSLGGTRFFPYRDETSALTDVLRLSKAMGYKSAAAGLGLGGGKAVIIGDPKRDKSEALLRAYGRFVDSLGGRYLTAEDVGTTQEDMDIIASETPYVTGFSTSRGGSGDPSTMTALGVFEALHAAAEARFGCAELTGRHVAIQGVGKVGSALARLLAGEGAQLTVADIDESALERCVSELGAGTSPPEKIHAVESDVFAPCALGATLDNQTVPELRCEIVCGAANNQLLSTDISMRLHDAGILLVPDFIANAGGVINIAEELEGYDEDRARGHVRQIRTTTSLVLTTAEADGVTPYLAACQLAEDRINSVTGLSRIQSGRLEIRGRP
jgi:glutamate dehydrogenase/leucine dehydrogenase